jgi:hypothetical protein
MPKILGNSSGKNNKSCRTFHNESNKIWFAFFWFFYNFLRILQDSLKLFYYLRLGFTGRPLELLFLSQIGPWFTKNTLERTRERQCSPWAWRTVRLAEIGRLRWRPWPGKGWGKMRGLPNVDLWPRMGGGALAAGRPTAHREHSRGGLCSSELPAWNEPRAAQGGCRGSRAAAKRVGLRRYWPEGAAPRWGA